MQINANFRRGSDSQKMLQRLDEIREFDRGNVKILFNNRSPEDQKLLQHLRIALSNRRWYQRISPDMLRTCALATVCSVATMAYGLASLFEFPAY